MAFTIPSNDVAFHVDQSRWFDTDIAILLAGLAGTGVKSGAGVTAQGSPDMTVAVAAGVIYPTRNTEVSVASGNVTISAAHATNPRIDLVSASAAGVKTVTAGTAAALPKAPDLPAGHVGLAMVYVPATDTTIATNQITDKRVVLAPDYATIPILIDGGGSVITTGVKGDIRLEFPCVIESVTVLLDLSGSIVVDIWKDTYANYPPVVGDSITASAKPTVSAALKSTDATLTGWTKIIAEGDILRFNVDSVATATKALVSLKVRKA